MGLRLIIILCAALAISAPSARAAIYKYVDGRGVTHYSNAPGDSRYKQVDLNSRPRSSSGRSNSTKSSYKLRVRKLQLMQSRSKNYSSYAFDHHIRRAARAHRVDPLLIKAIIQTESNFDQYAVSSQGAKGLMQLMPETAKDLQVGNPFDAAQNIYGGTRYVKQLLDSYQGNLSLCLAAYNAGPSRVKNGRIPAIPETVNYVKKVLRLYRAYSRNSRTTSSVSNSNNGMLVTYN